MVKRAMFMWEWQHVFHDTVESLLKKTLKLLPTECRHGVFVLGIPANTTVGMICIEPENSGYLPSDFATVVQRAEAKHAQDPARNFVVAAEHLMERLQASLWPKALREAVQEVLRELDVKSNTISFCAFPVRMREHWVMSIAWLERQAVESHHRLQRDRQALHPYYDIALQRSLVDAAIQSVFAQADRALRSESRGEDNFPGDTERVLEDAASLLLSTVSMRVSGMGGNIFGLANAISAERYEGVEGRGRMILARKGHPDVLARIRLKTPVSISQYRGVRKLLETSS